MLLSFPLARLGLRLQSHGFGTKAVALAFGTRAPAGSVDRASRRATGRGRIAGSARRLSKMTTAPRSLVGPFIPDSHRPSTYYEIDLRGGIRRKDWDAVLTLLGRDASAVAAAARKPYCEEIERGARGDGPFDDGLPLHHACLRGAPLEVVRDLTKIYPGGVAVRNSRGALPVHVATRQEAPPCVISLLRSAMEMQGVEGDDRSLLRLICWERDWKAVMDRLETEDGKREAGEAATSDASDFRLKRSGRPLHRACEEGAPEDVVEALIDAYPEALSERDGHERLPLHYACLENVSSATVRLLLGAHPGAVVESDFQHHLPLHLATLGGASREVIEMLREMMEQEGVADNRNLLIRIAHKDWDAVLARLESGSSSDPGIGTKEAREYDLWDSGGLRPYNFGLPIHRACSEGAPLAVVEALIRAYPGATAKTCDEGWLPLHAACWHGSPPEIVQVLIDQFPEGLTRLDRDKRLPVELAREKGATDKVLGLLDINDGDQ